MIIFRWLFPLVFFLLLALMTFCPSIYLFFLQKTHFDISSKPLIRQIFLEQDENINSSSHNSNGFESSPPINWRIKTNEQCVACHNGIESISDSHPPEIGCVVCHGGNENSLIVEDAHRSLIFDPVWGNGKKNPSHLKLADKSCGQSTCHSSSSFQNRDHVSRLKKSLMGTLAGVISGLRYQWAAQSFKSARYGVYSIRNFNFQNEGLPFLESLPFFSKADWRINTLRTKSSIKKGMVSHHIADNLLSKSCFQCHLDSPPPLGVFRGQGCAACHMPYSKSGLYEGNDPTINKTQTGHVSKHKFEALPPNSTCVTCHRVFADEKNFLNLNKSTVEGNSLQKNNLFPGLGSPIKDIHFEKGMDCIDCHTSNDIMGDGNIYSKQHEAVEIRCQIFQFSFS